VLFDDRNRPPVKFNDANLLRIPIRITTSPRTPEKDKVKTKRRIEKDSQLVPLENITTKLKRLIGG
jgi:prolyl-tRNA synthetase